MNDSAMRPRQRRRNARVPQIASVPTLASLVGAHSDALRDIYGSGAPLDSTTRSGLVEGRILAFEKLSDAYLLTRPIVRLISQLTPWKGKVFESGGTSGTDRVSRWSPFRFRCEVGESLLDGHPALILRYDGLGNPWPVRKVVDELREVRAERGIRVAIGPRLWTTDRGSSRPIAWWGVSL